jgi:hypothetical protein
MPQDTVFLPDSTRNMPRRQAAKDTALSAGNKKFSADIQNTGGTESFKNNINMKELFFSLRGL